MTPIVSIGLIPTPTYLDYCMTDDDRGTSDSTQ